MSNKNKENALDLKDKIFKMACRCFRVFAIKITETRFELRDEVLHMHIAILITGAGSVLDHRAGSSVTEIYIPNTRIIETRHSIAFSAIDGVSCDMAEHIFKTKFFIPVTEEIYKYGMGKK